MTNTEEGTPRDDMFTLLSRPRQRALLWLLASFDQPQAVADLATELARREHDTAIDAIPWEDIKQHDIRLHHVDLPKLADAGLVTYDEGDRMAALTTRGARLVTEFKHVDDGPAEVPQDGRRTQD